MDEYMHGRINSDKCLEAGTCKPLGGHSVWASLPLLPTESLGDTALPTILVLSSMDGSGLFHDLIEVVPFHNSETIRNHHICNVGLGRCSICFPA